MEFIKKNWKGLLFCLAIAVPSAFLGKKFPRAIGRRCEIYIEKDFTICSCIAWFWIEFRSRYADRKTITTDYSVYDYNFSCNCVYAS